MPTSHRGLYRLVTTSIALAIAGCAGKSQKPAEAPQALVAEIREENLAAARAELERGQALAEAGAWADAREAFDRAVDLLLALPGGVDSTEDAAALYDDVVATVHETERAQLEALSDTLPVAEPSESAAVDELTSDASETESDELLEAAVEEEGDVAEVGYDIPVELNSRVQSLIEMFQERKRDWFQEALDRSGHYVPMIKEIFAEEGLPKDLLYLAMVESAFKERALSRAGARGIWQFISGTGRLYGLEQDFWVDDRFDPEKATRAAARHLKDLYEEFGDWYLVMAAYNSGARRVDRAIRRTGSRDFWTLAARRRLPRETRSYVPLILATIVIAKNPEAYGFTPSTETPREYDVVRLDHAVDLETAAKSAGTTVDEMKRLNPQLRRWVTPLDREDYPLRVPKGSAEVFRTALAQIPEDERVRFGTHVVQRGDTLSRIAHRYGTSIDALTAANGIRRRTIIHPGQVLTVPVPPGALAQDAERYFGSGRDTVSIDGREVYVVRRGDTLGAIASSFRMGLGALRRLNDIPESSSRIYPGQKLVVSGAPASSRRASMRATGGDVYVVRPGDTLGQIADAHGIGLSVLRRLNGMSPRSSRIYPGQKLFVSSGSVATAVAAGGSPVTYRVRWGDTLSVIARRFGVSVEELRRWNAIDSDTIVAGQSLTVRTPAGTN